ncbi:hypothetical protein M9435_002311 [Picochlorum sp. BPE23]|nr:hypothetical protein M9435_002311 [Picochlorum sp. BPE23]
MSKRKRNSIKNDDELEGATSLTSLHPQDRHTALVRHLSEYYKKNELQGEAFETDDQVLKESYRFIRTEDDDRQQAPWVVKMARTYYSKLFREYALVDLSKAEKKGMVGLRWRSHKETVQGKGQFACGAVDCQEQSGLASYELPFKYIEAGEKKVALVKVRVCPDCSRKLLAARQDASASAGRGEKKRRKEKAAHKDAMFTGLFE